MPTRMFAVSAAVVGAAVLATGITYAAQSESDQAAPEAKQAAPAAEHAAPPAKRAAPPVKKAAPPVKKAAPEAAPAGTDSTAAGGTRVVTTGAVATRTVTVATAAGRREESTSTNGRSPPMRTAVSPLPVGWAPPASASTTTATRRLRSTAGSTATTVRRWPRSDPTAPRMASRPRPTTGAAGEASSSRTGSWAVSG